MIEALKKQILKYMSRRDYVPTPPDKMRKAMSVPENLEYEFEDAFKELRESGKLVVGSGNVARLPAMGGRVKGTFQANPKGFGFVIPDEANRYGDLFIPTENRANAMSGDKVIAKPMKRGRRQGEIRYAGIIVKVLERGTKRVVGNLRKVGDEWQVMPDGSDYVDPVIIDDVGAKNARENDKVVVDIIVYPTFTELARGAIVEVLGRAGQYDAEIKATIEQYDLPEEFTEEHLDQARDAAAKFAETADGGREDITDTVLVTIDPPDARDFDDAISLKRLGDETWVLGIHIADVSTFVGMDSPLDVEAKERGNSVYLPGKVIPMLPEILSNGICSLQPGQKRYAKSVYVTYDRDGNVQGREFANSLIESSERLTYEQADKIIKGDTCGFSAEVVALVKDMEVLARAIEARRKKAGMLHLDLPETELELNEEGQVVDAHPADDSYPHTIIEMFMVEANEAVASLLDRFDVPFIRRIHPDPEPAKAKELSRFVKICGFKLPKKLDRSEMQDLLEAVKGTSYEFAINMHVLRSLQKAEYSPLHIGHFALASKHYCHFTSPIRRYADLTVHRLLQCYLENRLNQIGLEEVLPPGELTELGSHISFTEQQAARAEDDLKTVLILEMLSSRLGDEIDGVVSGLTGFGIFVQCQKYGVEGLVDFGDLGMDYWKFDQKNQAVVGKHTGKAVRVGDSMRAKIVAVDVPARRLTLAPVKMLVTERPKQKFSNGGKKGRKGRRKGRRKKSKGRR
ncbi:Ribonuclease R [Anaerohalosphaera lusitana]|uniref:Ribonuclease R n=1 Tax=Anaerohalosphaera lusitana TaxID=1936003 RepID=A0A1U9NHH3_9BACT|nr:ribonuclease R [Anaerohalosphaera lusitana]AQT67382.1 Ribonuclease R [Anaerohalosphaera lusitana]